MKFWRCNRLDAEFEANIQEVAEEFVAAVANNEDLKLKLDSWPLDRSLRDWLTSPGGFNSTWDDNEAYDDLIEAVRVQFRLHEEAMDPAPILTGQTPNLTGGN
jgi:hypothetical protein